MINNNPDGKVRNDSIVKVISGERFTPFNLARKLNAIAILESSSFKKGKERYSLLMVKKAFTILQKEQNIFLQTDKKLLKIKSKGRDILDVLLHFSGQNPTLHQDFPLPSGGIGFLSYEFAAQCDTINFKKKPDPLNLPDASFLFGHIILIFDHYTEKIYLIGLNYNEHEIDLNKALKETEEKLYDLNFNYLSSDKEKYNIVTTDDNTGKDDFIKGVELIKKEIIKGNLLQGVLSRRIHINTDLPALTAYKNLRTENPSPYLFYIDFGEYQIFGSSPEVQIKVKERKAIINPIAGTRRRGKNVKEDKELENELLSDKKELAEHLMLVDLARNDLGRICKSGSIEVTRYMEIEHYSHVMHIVSQVEGILEDDKNAADAVRATFPAGTVSGAPKIRAIEVIDGIEKEPRRFYAGLVGYIESDGTLDSCITIRSGLKKGNIMILQAGAGIVYDSQPEREYLETGEKLMALTTAIGMEDK